MANGGKPTEATDEVIDDIYDNYDGLVTKMNVKNVENKKSHFNQIRKEYEATANQIVEKINKLN
jgi:hypothetical protein